MNTNHLTLIIISIFFSFNSYSKNPAIIINSDIAHFNEETNKAIHYGNVTMKQGIRQLTANKLVIQNNKQKLISLITAIGKPAIFVIPKEDPLEKAYIGSARTIQYFPIEEKIILIGQAEFIQGNDKIQGTTLTYYFHNRHLTSSNKDDQKTTFIIQPQSLQLGKNNEKCSKD